MTARTFSSGFQPIFTPDDSTTRSVTLNYFSLSPSLHGRVNCEEESSFWTSSINTQYSPLLYPDGLSSHHEDQIQDFQDQVHQEGSTELPTTPLVSENSFDPLSTPEPVTAGRQWRRFVNVGGGGGGGDSSDGDDEGDDSHDSDSAWRSAAKQKNTEDQEDSDDVWISWNLSNNERLPGNDKWFEDSTQQLLENISLDELGPSENNHQFGHGFDLETYSEN